MLLRDCRPDSSVVTVLLRFVFCPPHHGANGNDPVDTGLTLGGEVLEGGFGGDRATLTALRTQFFGMTGPFRWDLSTRGDSG